MSHAVRWPRLGLALSLALLAGPAWAGDEGTASEQDQASARAAMRRGIAAFGRGDAEEALKEYLAAEKAVPEANAPYRYAAEALIKLGRYREAIESLRKYLALRPNVSDAADVRDQIAELRTEHLPGKVTVTCTPKSATLFVDHAMSPSAECSTELDLLPGTHSLRAHLTGYDDSVVKVHVVGDKSQDVTLSLQPVRSPDRGISMGTWGWITAGAGGALLAAAVVTDVGFLGSTTSDFHAAAASGDPSAASLKSRADTLRVLSLIGYAAGGVGIATGTALILIDRGKTNAEKDAGATGLLWGVWGAPSGGGLSLSSAW